jgi:hydroxymethylglutaryl-CoA lyase
MRQSVRIVEVGPRDGLQNEHRFVPTATKLELIRRLAATGLKAIEATSFVSPKWVPQLADHADVMAGLPRVEGISFPVLTPNLRGFEAAVAAGAREVAVFASASEGFSQKNINCSIAESMQRFIPVFDAAKRLDNRVRGYVSCVIACPFDGPVAPAQVAAVAAELAGMGAYEISLGDTIGVGTPAPVLAMLEAVAQRVPAARLAGHFHDTYGMAIANAYAAWAFGLRTFDSSVAGLGGCPFAKSATGNVATEDLVYLLEGLGAATGVDLEALVACSVWISDELGREPASRVTRAKMWAGA